MKIVRIIIVVLLAVLMCWAWFSLVKNEREDSISFQENLKSAREYTEEELYQKAIQSYLNALDYRDNDIVWREMMDVYKISFEEGTTNKVNYQNALESACNAFPKEALYWEQLVELMIDSGSYDAAKSTLNKARRNCDWSDTLESLQLRVSYSFTRVGCIYSIVNQSTNGYASVSNAVRWGGISPDGDETIKCEYTFMSPYNNDLEVLIATPDYCRIEDSNRIVQSILDDSFLQQIIDGDILEMRALGDGVIPVRYNEGWRYYSYSNGEFAFGLYEEASTFSNELAAVKENGVWRIINIDGEEVSGGFDNIKLYGNGEYSSGGVVIASKNGKYGIFSAEGEIIRDFTAADIDLYMGGYIAFQGEDGLWGFIDTEGTVVIKPQYEKARSFSQGIASVYNGEYWGFINEENVTVIDYQYVETGYFTKGGCCFISDVLNGYQMIKLRYF